MVACLHFENPRLNLQRKSICYIIFSLLFLEQKANFLNCCPAKIFVGIRGLRNRLVITCCTVHERWFKNRRNARLRSKIKITVPPFLTSLNLFFGAGTMRSYVNGVKRHTVKRREVKRVWSLVGLSCGLSCHAITPEF